VIVPREEIDRFIERHGGIEIYGDGPDGPLYLLADGWQLWVFLDREAEAHPPNVMLVENGLRLELHGEHAAVTILATGECREQWVVGGPWREGSLRRRMLAADPHTVTPQLLVRGLRPLEDHALERG
jgi:hypothetical protein